MRRNRRVFVLILMPLGLAGAVWWFGGDHEASYRGRGLSDWVDRYQALDSRAFETGEVVDAIRHLGTNALPELVRRLGYDPAPRRKRASTLGRALPGFLRRRVFLQPLLIDQREFRANTATVALAVLGPEAGRALPELARLAISTNSPVVSRRAMRALTYVGDQGMAPLMVILNNRQHPYRVFAIDYIGAFGTNATMAVPALVEALRDPDLAVRLRATNSLRKVAPAMAGFGR